MKKHLFFIEFIFLCVFFIFPPLFSTTGPIKLSYSIPHAFSSAQITGLLVSLLLFIQHKDDFFYPFIIQSIKVHNKKFRMLLYSGIFLLTFGELTATASVIELAAQFFITSNHQALSVSVLNKGIENFSRYTAAFLLSAFYEETVFRMYLPSVISKFVSTKIPHNVSVIFGEVCSVLLFAFSHRYLGWFSVLNALFAAIYLRICYKKSGSIFLGTLAHVVYNLMMVAFINF
jgi:membrane protease YdiL (CAAX protease family)